MIWRDDFSKKTAGMGPGSKIFFNFCDFHFSLTMDHALSTLENFDCQGHNSLNSGQIFKILVPKHISFPSSCQQTLGRILDLHKISDLLGQRNDVLQTLNSWRKLASKV